MIYKQIGTLTNKLIKVQSNKPPFETIAITQPTIIDDNENKENYKKYQAIQIISGEFSEERNKPIIRNNNNLYYRDLIIVDIEDIDINSEQAIALVQRKLQDFKYLLYATIRHTEEKPRLRLILDPTKKMNEKEYKATIICIMDMLGLKFDKSSFVWSQPQGSPITTKSKIKDYIFIKQLKGEKFQVQQPKQDFNMYKHDENVLISYEVAVKGIQEYINKNSYTLQSRDNFIPCLMTLCKAVLNKEIEYSTGLECSRLLANIPNNSIHWEQENQKLFNDELKRSKGNINYFKTEYSFKDRFLYKTEKKQKHTSNTEKKKGEFTLVELRKTVGILRNIKYNEMTNLIEIQKDGDYKTLDNRDIQLLRIDLSEKFNINFSVDDIKTAIYGVSEQHKYHPIKEIIEPVSWDKKPRAEKFFINCLGVEDTPSNREVTRKWLLACITRLYEKGRKFDEMVILYGGQGIGKSTSLESLALDHFYTKVTGKLSNETILQTSKSWLIELDELSTLLRTPNEEFKAWLSSRKDTTRVPYEPQPVDFLRGFVVLGTTNNKEILKDHTGNRRFWLLDCNKDKIKTPIFSISNSEILQLWAEVLTWYHNKESLLLSNETRELMEQKAENYIIPIPYVEEIKSILNMKFPSDWKTIIHSKYKFRLHKYVTDILNAGVSEEEIQTNTMIDNITTQELYFLLTGNYRTSLNGVKATKDISNAFNKLDSWEYSKKIVRGKKNNLRGYKKKVC